MLQRVYAGKNDGDQHEQYLVHILRHPSAGVPVAGKTSSAIMCRRELTRLKTTTNPNFHTSLNAAGPGENSWRLGIDCACKVTSNATIATKLAVGQSTLLSRGRAQEAHD